MPDLQTGEEFFGTPTGQAAPPTPGHAGGPTPGRLQTGAEFFASVAAKPALPPQSGAANNAFWSTGSGGKVLNAFGEGAADAWGSRPLGLDPQSEAALRKAGIFDDYKTAHATFLQGISEAVIRPAASLADLAVRGSQALLGSAAAGLTKAGTEFAGREDIEGNVPHGAGGVLGGVLAGAGELARGAQEGAIGPEFLSYEGLEGAALANIRASAATNLATDAARARSIGVIGEGEEGFYGAAPVTPDNVQTRTDAAREAGIEAPPPEPPAPDIHALARRIDPETFQEFDALALESEQHRATISALGEERANSPEALEAQAQIDTILGKVRGVTSRLTGAASERLTVAQERLDTILTTDTPEMTAARNGLMNADFAMRDLSPQVSDAYRMAADMMPERPPVEAGAEATGKAPETAPVPAPPKEPATGEAAPEAAAQAPQRTPEEEAGVRAAPIAASVEGEAAVAPANVLGEQKLGEVGETGVQGSEKPPTARYGNLRAVEGTGETATRGLSEHVEEKAIEEGLTSNFGDLPEYQRLSMADQAAKVTTLMDEDYGAAKAIAMGDRAPPKGVLPESVYVGVEKRALAEGDAETLRQLATRSRLTTTATTMGQRIRTLGERDTASPVGAIQEVQKAREVDFAKGRDIAAAKAETVAEARAETRKAASKPDAWKALMESIQCGEG
jgi:hypothetical protein